MNSHLLPLFISYRSSGEKLIKYQANSSCVIMFVILMTTLFYKALILQGENWCWSLLGLKGLRELSPTQISLILPISNILRCFDWVFWRPYRYFSFVLKSDVIPVWSLWGFHHWMILDRIAVINCLIKNVQNDSN